MQRFMACSVAVLVCSGIPTPVSAEAGSSAFGYDQSVVANADQGDHAATRILGGTEVKPDDYPWVANQAWNCGGSLVSPDVIITAAHCMMWSSLTYYVGDGVWNKGQRTSSAAIREGSGLGKADWAVVKLAQPVQLSAYVQVPIDGSLDSQPTLRTLGWGMTRPGGDRTTTLLQVDMPRKDCGRLNNVEICAGDSKTSGCKGDSGGPLLAKNDKGFVLVGMTSWGEGDCATDRSPGHWAKLSAFLPEVKKAITDMGGTMPTAWAAQP